MSQEILPSPRSRLHRCHTIMLPHNSRRAAQVSLSKQSKKSGIMLNIVVVRSAVPLWETCTMPRSTSYHCSM